MSGIIIKALQYTYYHALVEALPEEQKNKKPVLLLAFDCLRLFFVSISV
ncbi:hypothetical protein PALB_2190 [Pseudoalteromonas luteoviolacea B = ATCC 29581]|nr:hypothetical protein PALB_2190 [Pseudoalteromonas luteoviolacea B = ATCC 29581]